MAKTKNSIIVNGEAYTLRTSKVTFGTSPVHVSDGMSGKMEGIPSVSTSCTVNPVCIARMQNGESICSKCFAFTTMKMRKELREALESNYRLLNSGILPDELLPNFGNVRIVRIESFGDLGSVTQAINYVRMIRKNPDVLFAWWTKNKAFAEQAFKTEGKPENLVFVESSFLMNQVEENPSEYADRVFTVYDKKHASGVEINCGSRKCMECMNCYRKTGERNVSELLK